jgi:transglutaminase/protease-like cytokinesis protein 3
LLKSQQNIFEINTYNYGQVSQFLVTSQFPQKNGVFYVFLLNLKANPRCRSYMTYDRVKAFVRTVTSGEVSYRDTGGAADTS